MAVKSSLCTGKLLLTYAVHMLLQLFDRLVRDRRYPVVDEEGVYNTTSTDRSGRRAWASNANERLNSLCHQLEVFHGAIWSVNVLHDYVSDGEVGTGARESVVYPGNAHGCLWFGVKIHGNPVLR